VAEYRSCIAIKKEEEVRETDKGNRFDARHHGVGALRAVRLRWRDANGNPHLHFEVHPNDGADVDPFRHLKRAVKPLFAARAGAVFSLALHGKLVAAGAGGATLDVDRVRQYPGGRWLDIDPREIELTVPLGTDVAGFAQLAGASLRPLKRPADVTAYTLKANATPGAIVGAPGALLLGRVAGTPIG